MRIQHPRLTLFRLIFLLLALIAVEAQADVRYASTATASIELHGTFHAMGVIVTIAAADDPDGDATAAFEYCTGSQAYQAGFPLSRVDDTHFGRRQARKAGIELCLPLSAYWCILNQA